MEDWKKRLVEEYTQLRDRYEKLRAFNNKREVEGYFADYIEPHKPEEKKAAPRPEQFYNRPPEVRTWQKTISL